MFGLLVGAAALVPTGRPLGRGPASVRRSGSPLLLDPPAPIVIFGPGSLELRLITAKLAARAGFEAALISAEGTERGWLRQMYGAGADDTLPPSSAKLLVGAEQIGAALKRAEALCVVCDAAAIPGASLDAALAAAPALARVVLVSQMGVTRAKPAGPFGLGGAEAELLEAEGRMRAATASRGIELSIVRVGTLKGGGPGAVEQNMVVSGVEIGLSKAFYDSIFDLETALVTQSHDKFTVGAKVAAGDPVDLPNAVLRMARKGSFEPRDDETNRAVACGAVVHALRHPSAVELTVSAARGELPPTPEEWAASFEACGS